jgi:hypothetical protein
MNPTYSQTALICPYSLMEEEALAWSTLLFNQALLLHPFPLTLPASYQPLLAQGWLQVLAPDRSQDEIRLKDKSLRQIQAFISSNPDQGLLKYLNQVNLQEDRETQEELVGLLKGQPPKRTSPDSLTFNGHVLLCLIHEWMMQEWALDDALAKIEEQEKSLAQGWQDSLEEGSIWSDRTSRVQKRNEIEIPCPLALKAWRELKNQMVPEPGCLFSGQPWVWNIHYGTDWEEDQVISIVLPDMSSSISGSLPALRDDPSSKEKVSRVVQTWESLLMSLSSGGAKRLLPDFQRALAALDLPDRGRYRLIIPLFPPSQKQSKILYGQDQTSLLVLITA